MDSSLMLCPSCERQVIFSNDIFGCIRSQCGLVLDDETELVAAATDASTSSRHSKAFGPNYAQHWIQREARKAKNTNASPYQHHGPPPSHVTAVISRILDHSGRANLQRETIDLFNQIKVISQEGYDEYGKLDQQRTTSSQNQGKRRRREKGKEEGNDEDEAVMRARPMPLNGEEREKKVAVAATFSVLKRHIDSITLEQVCHVAAVASLLEIAEILRTIELLLGGTQLLEITRDEPSAYLHAHAALLQAKLAAGESATSDSVLIDWEEQKFIKAASILSDTFTDLAADLCTLCVRNGLHNRSAKLTSRKDLSLCAWAILLLAMEASAGKVSREGRMAEVAAGLNSQQAESQAGAPSTISTSSELIKKRYVEISRMLSTYLEHLPWLSDEVEEREAGDKQWRRAAKKKGQKTCDIIKEGLTSIKPMSRRTVAKYLTDVIKLQRFIEKKMNDTSKLTTTEGWSRFGSTEDFFHRIRASASGQREIKEEQQQQQRRATGTSENLALPEKQNMFAAVDAILQAEENNRKGVSEASQLAQSIGHDLLQLASLESMSEQVVDSLLFQEGEMESYLRTEGDITLLKQLRIETGEWNRSESPDVKSTRKRSRSTEAGGIDHVRHIKATGKRTKAIPEEEADRILSTMDF